MFQIPAELITFFIGMTPILELRGAIPLGIGLGLSPFVSFVMGTAGNLVIAIVLPLLFDPLVQYFLQIPWFHRYVQKRFEKLHTKHSKRFNRWGALALVGFVALPIPGTGAWTGAALSYLFNIPYRLAATSIAAGVVIAGILVTFVSKSAIGMVNSLF